jgi:hypothetical protein
MPPPARKRLPDAQRRALELLAGCDGAGCPEGLIVAHGFSIDDMVELLRRGITEAGRRAAARDTE